MCLIQDGFSAASTVVEDDFCSPIRGGSSLRGLTSFVPDLSTIREGSLKRHRIEGSPISDPLQKGMKVYLDPQVLGLNSLMIIKIL